MSTIAYVGLPAHGHTNPSLPVVKALVLRGHRVLYYNAEAFRAKVEPTGVDFRPFPEPMPSEREISEAMGHFVNASLMLSGMTRPLAHFLIEAFETDRPDLIIYDTAAPWGYVSARSLDIPQVCFSSTFVLDGLLSYIGYGTFARFLLSSFRHLPTLLRWRRQMAAEFGKENAGGITEYADRNIVFTSKAFHPPNDFIDDRFFFVGPSIDPSTRDGAFPFDQLTAETKVYISLGTINHLNLAFYRAAFEAFGDFPGQFVLSAGKNTDLGLLDPVPDNFIVQNYVPQLDVLQQVDAFITHGGMNSVHEGLLYGVPEIVIPNHFEQYLNGKRVVETGSGLMLGDREPFGRVTAAELRTALETLLGDPNYRASAIHFGETLQAAGGFQKAADLVEEILPVEAAKIG